MKGYKRKVLGTFTKEHPLYKYYEYSDSVNVICDFNFNNEKYGRLYLANCSDEMVADVKNAFAYAGWDVSEDSVTNTEDYYGLVLPGENHLIPAAMLALSAFCILIAQRWNGKAEGDSMADFTFMLTRLVAALAIAIEVFLWTVESVRIFLKTKKDEYRVIELYGGSPGVIGKRIFLLSGIIVMPGVLASSLLLPIQFWRHLGLGYVDVNLFYMFEPKVLPGALAAGIVFALVVVLRVRG